MYEVTVLEGLTARAFMAITATFETMAQVKEKEPDQHEALMKQVDELYRLVIGHAAEKKLCPAVVIMAAMCAIGAAVMEAAMPN